MDHRLICGTLVAQAYNTVITRMPSRLLRKCYLKMFLRDLGEGTGVQMGCRFLNGRKISLGKRNVINFDCLFDGRKYAIRTGDDVSIGPEAAILTLGHDPQSPIFADRGGEVTIGDHVWIGYRALILPGVSIGTGAVVAAGAVVTRDVEPFTIVAGSPARKIGGRPRRLDYHLDFQPLLA
jgi:maltose O-acetyltransferase